MRKGNRKKVKKRIGLLVLLVCLAGCGQTPQRPVQTPQESTPESSYEEEFVVPGPNSYDSEDTAVVVGRDEATGTMTFLNLEKDRTYTLSIDGTTTIFDKYGDALSLQQIADGEIVDLTFLRSKKRVNSMQVSEKAWIRESISKYEINPTRKDITIGRDVFQFTGQTVLFSQGKQISLMDLNPMDVLTFRGIGSSVYSVNVEQGHGYLRLQNDQQFIGGFIEIGSSIIHVISEDMLLTVPEGSYQVTISHKRGGGVKPAVITRNKETVLDLGDLELEEIKEGIVFFTMEPSKAVLYVDGNKVDTSQGITLEYGIHQIIARAEGYETLTSYIKVGSESGAINVTLDVTESDSKKDQTSGYKVYVDSPVDTEIYVDGNYVGIAPVSFKKEAGSHSITLRKSGCETRNYTVQIDSEAKDVNFSFAPLEKASEEKETEKQTPEKDAGQGALEENQPPKDEKTTESTENTED